MLSRLGRDHSTLAGRDRLARVEAKTAKVTQRSRVRTAVPAAKGTRGILNDPEIMPSRCLKNRVHVRAEPKEVDRNDAHGA